MATPMTWYGSPIDNAVETRYIWDRYIDTDSGIVYVNTNATGNTGWQAIQTMPA